MATGEGPSIEEEQNFTRIQKALSYCGIAVLKELFLQRVRDLSPPNQPNGCWTVDEFLFEKMYVILRSIGNDSHKKSILYRQNTDLEKWDVSLFVHVLLAACDISAAGGTLRHDITNLSSLRNKLCHTPHPKLSAVIYTGYIGRVRGSINRICVFLNNQTLTQNVNETLDKYESLTHAYPNDVLEEHVKYNDIVSEDPDREERGEQGGSDRDVADIVKHLVQGLFRVSQISSSKSLSQKMTLSVKQDDECSDAVRYQLSKKCCVVS
ncbi:hypothetical protein MAR_033325 [Mya arenaria]|uniref:DZIP3-like HEPN domain-containing protein n=1 Tax=Mya arenaria TaxID=6604 RepID=A0ABY7G8M8_MYAAR|nr:hypothetical protein MAR_033325 [Mya arenaria]